jgi:hypothetical protein
MYISYSLYINIHTYFVHVKLYKANVRIGIYMIGNWLGSDWKDVNEQSPEVVTAPPIFG